ncbi:MAG: ATP synthase F1 subunit delta [Acidimicrobiia bacterium]|jgi:F-type H+-transporting ATPase subunit delta
MSDRVDAYADALLAVAKAEGVLGAVEDDLFRFARTFEGSDELRMALTDPALPAERRMAVVDDLMGGKALAASAALVAFVVGIGRAHDLPAVVDRFVEKAAHERKREVAEVRSAVPLDDRQRERLTKALSKATGKEVEVKVVVDPTVLGGLVATVGDTVIDGTVRHRLDQLRERI